MSLESSHKKYIDPFALNLEVAKYNGDEVLVRCPFHDDHSPSATFNVVSGLFHCFACGTGRNLKQLKSELGGIVVYVKSLTKIERTVVKALDNTWRKFLTAPQAIDSEYLKGRGVANGFVILYNLLRFPHGIGFPIENNRGQVTGIQIRQFPPNEPRYLFMGIRQPLWPIVNLQSIPNPDRPLIVTEGVFSALRVIKSGYNAVAVMGASNILPAIKMLSGRDYLVLFDGDEAGYLGAAKFAALGKNVALVPHGFEADEWHQLALREFLDECTYTGDVELVAEASTTPKKVLDVARSFRKTARR